MHLKQKITTVSLCEGVDSSDFRHKSKSVSVTISLKQFILRSCICKAKWKLKLAYTISNSNIIAFKTSLNHSQMHWDSDTHKHREKKEMPEASLPGFSSSQWEVCSQTSTDILTHT